MTTAYRILIVDDEPGVRGVLHDLLGETYDCAEAASASEALSLLKSERFDLILCDIRMPGMSGLDLVPLALKCSPETVVVMISGEGGIESAIDALRAGVYDYVRKPFTADEVEAVVRRALGHRELLAAKRRYEQDLEKLVAQRTSERDQLTYYDPLTGLPNRALFEDRLTRALGHAQLAGSTLAVAVYSLDRLRAVNETLGYVNGDEALRVVAGRLSAALSGDDTVARWGGNEFAVLLTSVRGAEDVAAVTREISDSLKVPLDAGGHELTVSVSAGISVYPHDGRDAHGLLRNAVAALRRAKEQGGGVYQFYTAEMNVRSLRRLTLESGLRRAVEAGELVLHYQPQVDTATGRVIGLEALARWEHSGHGIIAPAEFIPLAEETGLIIPLGEWVLRRACSQVKAWQEEGLAPPTVAVNLSGRQFRRSGLPELVSRVLEETRLPPSSLRLELTESSIMEDTVFAAGVLKELKAKGVGLSIDDFGTGYSSLSYLKRLPVDELKIDRSFVHDATNNEDDAAIVAAIVLLARTLRLEVVAEGVETEGQLELLRSLACGRAQGFLFSRPLPAEEVRSLLPKREGKG